MPLKTTTIGSYPKPVGTPIEDCFMNNKSEADRQASKGLLANWSAGEYESAINKAGDKAEVMFLEATKEVISD